MKKHLFVLLLAAMLMLCTVCPVFADYTGPAVVDQAGIMTASQVERLEAKALALAQEYGCGVYIVTVENMGNYGYSNIAQFAEDYCEQNRLGVGAERNSILLMLSMAERDYDLDARGNYGNYAFTDYGKTVLADAFIPDFRNDRWYDGFAAYLEECEALLTQAKNGTPVDVYYNDSGDIYYGYPQTKPSFFSEFADALPAGLFFGAVAALLYCSSLKKKMNTVQAARGAEEYMTANGVNITRADEHFTHRTVTRTQISSSSSSGRSGGGYHSGGTHVSSGGHSHSSGKF